MAGNAVLLLFAYPIIYVIERVFGYITDVTLIELGNSNNKLLRELAEKAPGTFQHSLQVANLAEEASYAIGGNACWSGSAHCTMISERWKRQCISLKTRYPE